MALDTENPFLDAIGGTPWPKTAANTSPVDGAIILTVYFDNEITEGHSVGGAWTEAEKSAFWGAMRTWSSVANVRFLEVDKPEAADMIERKVTTSEEDAWASHSYASDSEHIGLYNTDRYWTPGAMQPGGVTFQTFVHELGHAIGLAHPHDTGDGTGLFPGVDDGASGDTGDNSLNSSWYTIMSYIRPGVDPDVQSDRGFSAAPGAFDIAAIQLMYGAVGGNYGDTVYTLRDDAPGVSYTCIWDTGGIDTIRYDGSRDATINLQAATLKNESGGGGFVSSVAGVSGGFTIAADVTDYDDNGNLGVIIENAVGGSGSDYLSGNAVNNVLEGRGGADTFKGGGGYDTLIGGAGDDTYVLTDVSLRSFSGLVIGESYDRVVEAAGEGIDTVKVQHVAGALFDHTSYTLGDNIENGEVLGSGAFNLTGNGLRNELVGNAFANTLTGLGGDDLLAGGDGRDRLIGGEGNDSYVLADVSLVSSGGLTFGETYDTVVEAAGQGTDTVRVRHVAGALFDHTSYTLLDNFENGVIEGADAFNLTGNGLDNHLVGNAAANTLTGLGSDDVLYGGDGLDRLVGGDGNDIYLLGDISFLSHGGMFFGESYDTVTETAGGGTDTVWVAHAESLLYNHADYTLMDSVENGVVVGYDAFSLVGNQLDNRLEGNGAANTLTGLDGDDTLDGKGGRDVLVGGAGDDTYELGNVSILSSRALVFGESYDTVVEAASEGFDTVKVGYSAGVFFDHTHYTLGDNIERGIVVGDDAFNITGNEFDNQLEGNGAANTLAGAGGADTMFGGGADDILDGGVGADVAVFRGAKADYVISALDNGRFQVVDQVAGRDGADVLVDIETLRFADGDVSAASLLAIIGTPGDDKLVGDDGDNDIQGLAGDDVLVGQAGAVRLSGGADRDILYVDAADAVIDGGDGFDIVYADASTAATGLNFALAGSNVEAVFGNAGNDVLDASGTNDYFAMLYGGGGDDVLIGGSNGNYTLQGGTGNDTVVLPGNQADYVIDGQPGGWPSWITATNTQSGTIYWLQTVEHLQFDDGIVDVPVLPINQVGTDAADELAAGDGGETLYGTGGDDGLTGGAGNDIIEGGAGADRLIGGDGNDALFIDNDDVLVDGGAGYDSVYADDTQGAPAGLHFRLAGTGVEFVYGGMGGDVIDASGVATAVELWGQWGDDILTGGDGDDVLMGDEWLPGGGGDQLFGGPGNDWLFGGSGNNLVAGGSGNDTYYVDSAGDVVVEDADQGDDVVYASVNYTLAKNVETLYLQGTATSGAGNGGANWLYGNALDNTLSGNGGDGALDGAAGNDILDGGTGKDVMTGGTGGDTYYVDDAGDVVVEDAGQDEDVVYSSVNNYALAENVETLYLQGTTANGSGNSGANSLYSNASNNLLSGFGGEDQLFGGAGYDRLRGGGGNDRLDGGAGADRLSGGGGKDTFVFLAGEAEGDVVADFAGKKAEAGDNLLFVGFGTAEQGATFTRVGIDQWQIHSGLDGHNELIDLSYHASVHATDYVFA